MLPGEKEVFVYLTDSRQRAAELLARDYVVLHMERKKEGKWRVVVRPLWERLETTAPLPVPDPITGSQAAERGLLRGRQARCCDAAPPKPSDPKLAFFEYLGPGSAEPNTCARCGYYWRAHTVAGMAGNVPDNRATVIESGKCTGFVPRKPAEHDRYYCGHAGWD